MYNHAPADYQCPLCLAIQGTESDATMMKQADIIYRDEWVLAAINSKFIPSNPGHVIVFPVEHYEHIYDLPDAAADHVIRVAKKIAVAMKSARHCDGIMMVQNNEPASGQHAFHYHLHVFPRFENDHIQENMLLAQVSRPEDRLAYANDLKRIIASSSGSSL